MELIKRFMVEEEGADATEYALVIGLIALAIVVGASTLGTKIGGALGTIGNRVNACNGVTGPASTTAASNNC